jgi:hypothetical protein
MKTSVLVAVSALACVLGVMIAVVAKASPITFTDITTASGTIGSTSFTNDPITISAASDTSGIVPISGGFSLDDSSASVTIGSLGTFNFTTGTRFFVNNTVVGFSRSSTLGADLIDGPSNPAFSSWAMLTSIGPFTGIGIIQQWDNVQCPTCPPLPAVVTNGGTLVLDNASPNVTFSAQIGTVPAPLIGRGLPVLLAVGGILFGVKVLERSKKRRLLGTAIPHAAA